MDLRHLEQIVAICETGAFSGAARKLRIAQPTLSRSISLLEAKLGLTLFERSGAGAKPTVHGSFVAERAAELLSGAERIKDELAQRARGDQVQIRIGVGPAIRINLLPLIINETTRHMMGLRIQTQQATGKDLINCLVERRFDVVLTCSEWVAGHANLIRSKVLTDDFIAVARAGHPAADQGRLSAQDLFSHSIACPNLPPSFLNWIRLEGQNSRIEKVQRFQSDDYDLIKDRSISSDYVALGPRFVFNNELASGSLVEIAIQYTDCYECWLVANPEAARLTGFKSLASIARSCGRSLGRP